MAVAQWVGKGVQPRVQAAGRVGHKVRHEQDGRPDGSHAACPCQHEPPQAGAAHEHQHRADAQNQQCAGKMGFQQHEHRHHTQHQHKGHHPDGKAAHAVVVERNDMRKHQHHRKFCDLTGLQGAQPRQHQPPLAAVVLRHEQHRHKQYQRKRQQRPRKPVINMVIHPAGQPHGSDAQRRIQQLRPCVGKGIAPPVQRHGAAGTAQHHQPEAHQREHQHQKGQVHGRQTAQRQAPPPMGCSFWHLHHLPSFYCTPGRLRLVICRADTCIQ